MAVLTGLNGGQVQFVPGPAGTPANTRAMPAGSTSQAPTTSIPSVIDGTPVRVVVLAVASAVGLMALHSAGFRFNVAVSA